MADLHYHTHWGTYPPDFSDSWTFSPWSLKLCPLSWLWRIMLWFSFYFSVLFCLPGWLAHLCSLSYFMLSSVFTLRSFFFQYVINIKCTYSVVSKLNFRSPALTSLLSSESILSHTWWNFHLTPTQSNTGLTPPTLWALTFLYQSCYPRYLGSRDLFKLSMVYLDLCSIM